MAEEIELKSYPVVPCVNKGALPDPFLLPEGGRVSSREEWPACGQRWREMIVNTEYGGMPPAPGGVDFEMLCHSSVRRWAGAPQLLTYRIHCRGGAAPFSFTVRILAPKSGKPCPAIITGDGCWWYLSEAVAQEVVAAGHALVMFNRTEFAEDLGYGGVDDNRKRKGGLYDVYPGGTFGALAAWAWGYHRCVDLLRQLAFIDPEKIVVTGHSRGAKAALLAGLTDERIGLVNDNASCAGGSAAFRYVGDGGETSAIANAFPSWFGAGFGEYVGREEALPFDQHCLLAAMAPRPVLVTYALDDRWSNPEGMVQSYWAAGEVYQYLGVAERLAFHLRPGGHAHSLEDWKVLLDFMRWQWEGGEAGAGYNQHPYRHLQRAFSWRAPDGERA